MSREIELTRGLKAIVDDDAFKFLSQFSWYTQKDQRGKLYAATSVLGDIIYMHRMLTDAYSDAVVDHKNGNTLDNRKENLIVSSPQENSMNKSKTKHKTKSKHKGVTKMKNGKWKAYIGLDDKDIHIGYFDTEEEAAQAYNERAKQMFGDRAKLNEET